MTVTAPFESGEFPVEVIVVWRPDQGWTVDLVLQRSGDEPPAAVAPWTNPFMDADPGGDWQPTWEYLADRVRDGSGGNYYSYELDAFEVADLDAVVAAVTNQALARGPGSNDPHVAAPAVSASADPTTLQAAPDPAPEPIPRHVGATAPTLVVDRVPPPRWAADSSDPGRAALQAITGEQLEWSLAIPSIYRALASPGTHEPVVQAPETGDLDGALAYWSALLHLLIYTLGWARPDRGLRWWYDAGKPTTDLRLRLVRDVWDADGHLDWFAAWLWTTPTIFQSDALQELTGYQPDDDRVPVDQTWLARTLAAADEFGFTAPAGTSGWDPLHLSMHAAAPLDRTPGTPVLVRSSRPQRQATLLLDSLRGWYRALAEHGATLPDLGSRSWHVDVVVRPVGWLGTYRRSRDTGLWFAGQHRTHTPGT